MSVSEQKISVYPAEMVALDQDCRKTKEARGGKTTEAGRPTGLGDNQPCRGINQLLVSVFLLGSVEACVEAGVEE